MRIAVDAMGGDYAPQEIVAGALLAAQSFASEDTAKSNIQILLVGRSDLLQKYLPSALPPGVQVIPASETIEMGDLPVDALRKKRDASLVVAAQMVKNGEADALVSAGNTGAVTAAAHLLWRCLPGVARPAIATVLPKEEGKFILIDSGATVDCTPQNLLQFALMGQAYAEVLGSRDPKVGLLNIGEEETKGNSLTKQAYALLKERLPQFIGNVEGKTLFDGPHDVVVCDGFVGNVALKTAQGTSSLLKKMFKDAMPQNPFFRLLVGYALKPGWERIKTKTDYAEYGGAPLLGVRGLCFICHGHSNARAIKNAICQVVKEYEYHLNERITERIQAQGDGADTLPFTNEARSGISSPPKPEPHADPTK